MKRYEEMLKKGRQLYFDVFQLEHIIDNFLEEGKIFPAFQAVEMGLNQHPSSIALKTKKVGILINMGEINQALDLCNQLIKIEDTNHELHLLQGSCYLLLGEDAPAKTAFNNSVKFSIEDKPETIFNIGFAYEQNGNFEVAIEYLKEAVYLDPLNEEAIYELAYCLEKIDENEKSIKYYNQYLDIDAYSDSAWFNLGILYTKMEKYKESIEAYDYALAINDEFPNAWFNMGHSNVLLNNFEDAIEAFTQYLKIDPENDEVQCLIGECYFNLKNYSKAKYHLNKSIKINPLNSKALHSLGILSNVEDNSILAIKYIRKAVNIEEENSQYHITLASTATVLKYDNEAISSYETACELEPEELSYWLSFSQMLFQSGRVIKSLETLKLALTHHDNNPLIKYRLAAYLLESGKNKEAENYLKQALKTDYENHGFLYDSYPDAKQMSSVSNLIEKYNPNGK